MSIRDIAQPGGLGSILRVDDSLDVFCGSEHRKSFIALQANNCLDTVLFRHGTERGDLIQHQKINKQKKLPGIPGASCAPKSLRALAQYGATP